MTAPHSAGGEPTIAFISLHASPLARLGNRENGGLNVYVRAVCEELGARGVHTDVFVRKSDPDQPDEQAMGPRSRVIAVEAGPPRPLAKHQLPLTRQDYLEAVRRYTRGARRRYIAVHSHYWLSGEAGAALAADLELPWLHTAHTLAAVKGEAGFDGDGPERLLAERRTVAAGARLVVNTGGEANALHHHYGARPGQCVVAPPGVDLVRFQPRNAERLRRRMGLDGSKVILFAGRLEPLKGPDTLLDAFSVLKGHPQLGGRTKLLFVGELSSEGERVGQRREMLQRTEGLGLTDDVAFLGAQPQERLALLYCLADLVVVPSHTESFGLVALEAQACGTPVVASAVGGLREVVADGRTGHLVDGRDPQQYAAAMARVLTADRAANLAMRQAARRRAERFTWERTVDVLLPEYGLAPAWAAVAGRQG
ncbi:MAG: glycosyltransferase [Candidatus Dormiibacterota bacterium]